MIVSEGFAFLKWTLSISSSAQHKLKGLLAISETLCYIITDSVLSYKCFQSSVCGTTVLSNMKVYSIAQNAKIYNFKVPLSYPC